MTDELLSSSSKGTLNYKVTYPCDTVCNEETDVKEIRVYEELTSANYAGRRKTIRKQIYVCSCGKNYDTCPTLRNVPRTGRVVHQIEIMTPDDFEAYREGLEKIAAEEEVERLKRGANLNARMEAKGVKPPFPDDLKKK